MGDDNRKYCPFGETESTSHWCNEDCPLWHEEANCCSIKAAADALRKIARKK
jgi:hypothetical protein